MWILPKQLITSAYVPDTKESGLDSEEFSQICERSLTWRGKDSLSRTWLQRWKRESWMQHLSSRTLRPSLTGSFVGAWTSSLADSRANHSVLPESVTALKIRDTCSPTSQTESESANLELFSSKTLKESSQPRQQTGNQFSNMSSESWKAWVTEQRREYSVRLKSAHLTRESESSSWPTATVFDTTGGSYPTEMVDGVYRSKHSQDPNSPWYGAKLRDVVETHEKNWPTATMRDHKGGYVGGRIRNGKVSMDTLDVAVQAHTKGGLLDQAKSSTSGKSRELQWPTPRANKVQPKITEENRAQLATRKKANLEEEIAGHCGKAVGQLNPDWVEHLMGLPAGWTDFAFSEME